MCPQCPMGPPALRTHRDWALGQRRCITYSICSSSSSSSSRCRRPTRRRTTTLWLHTCTQCQAPRRGQSPRGPWAWAAGLWPTGSTRSLLASPRQQGRAYTSDSQPARRCEAYPRHAVFGPLCVRYSWARPFNPLSRHHSWPPCSFDHPGMRVCPMQLSVRIGHVHVSPCDTSSAPMAMWTAATEVW